MHKAVNFEEVFSIYLIRCSLHDQLLGGALTLIGLLDGCNSEVFRALVVV